MMVEFPIVCNYNTIRLKSSFNKGWVEGKQPASRASLASADWSSPGYGRNPVYLGSESILTITEAPGVRVQNEVLGKKR